MKLLYSSASPYSAKVRMGASYAGIALEPQAVNTAESPAVLVGNNPLGKIPTLLPADGSAIYDSVAIMRHLDRLSGGKLYPSEANAALAADVLEALGDGIADCLLAIQYEHRSRPAEMVYAPWIEKQMTKATRALDMLEAAPPAFGETLTAGDFALAATLAYLGLRFADKWNGAYPALHGWLDAFAARFPAFAELKPQV